MSMNDFTNLYPSQVRIQVRQNSCERHGAKLALTRVEIPSVGNI